MKITEINLNLSIYELTLNLNLILQKKIKFNW